MKYIVILVFVFNLSNLFAKGVKAGTVIENRATMNFSLENEDFSIQSNVDRSVVAQILDVKVSWIDTREIVVSQGDQKKVLTYKVLNSGNGRDKYTIVTEELNSKSKFNLKRKRVYLDYNKNFYFDSEDRERKTISLGADRERMFFVVSNIGTDLGISSGSQNFVNFRAISKIGGTGVKGTIHNGKGVDGVDAVDGFSGGISEDEGVYKLLIANVILKKDVTYNEVDELITVTLTVRVGGEGSVKDVKIVDAIPSETKYVKGSLLLDGGQMSDQKDSDAGRYRRKYLERKAEIQMSLGELDTSSYHTITYNLRIR